MEKERFDFEAFIQKTKYHLVEAEKPNKKLKDFHFPGATFPFSVVFSLIQPFVLG